MDYRTLEMIFAAYQLGQTIYTHYEEGLVGISFGGNAGYIQLTPDAFLKIFSHYEVEATCFGNEQLSATMRGVRFVAIRQIETKDK